MDGLSLSIVIPTYNRRARLALVLDGLQKQSAKTDKFEVVVVDDGSIDDTAAWVRRHTFEFPLRLLSQQNQGPAAARNAGVGAAMAPFILFLDDDVMPGPDLVREHLKMHEMERDIVVMGPLSSLPHYRQPWVAWEQAKLDSQYEAMIRGDWAPTFRQFWTGNASLAREHLLAVGGFDTSFLRGEDVELGQRLFVRGLQFRFNPDAGGLHYAERSLASWSNAHRSYGRLEVQIFGRMGEGELFKVLGENWSRLHPLSRSLVRKCVGHRLPFVMASTALGGWLRVSELLAANLFSERACSVLANLLYWDASAEALGKATIREVFRRAAAQAG